MPSVADDLRRALRERVLAMTPGERVATSTDTVSLLKPQRDMSGWLRTTVARHMAL
jgi:hypothetical protein